MSRVVSTFSLRSVAALALVAGIVAALTLVLPSHASQAPSVKAASASVAQVTHVATASYSVYGASDSRSFTVPQGSSSNALLFVYAGKIGADPITSASYGGHALTRLVARGQGSARIEVWYLLGPPEGTATFAWSKSGLNQNVTWGLSLFAGVDGTTPFTSVVQTGATQDQRGGLKSVATGTVPIGSNDGSVLFDAAVFNGSTIPAGGPTAATLYSSARSALWARNKSTTEGGAAFTDQTGADPGWRPSGSPWFDWAIVAFGLRPVAAVSGAPAATALPIISVAAEGAGYVLTTTTGTWANSPSSFSYAWYVTPSDVGPQYSGAVLGTEATLHLRWPVGAGYYAVVVTATNAAGSATAHASRSLVPSSFTVVALPSIYGTPRVGQQLIGYPGEYLGVESGAPDWAAMNFGAWWLRCDTAGRDCVTIAGYGGEGNWPPLSQIGYTLTAADVGARLRVLWETTVLPGTSRPIGVVSAPTAVVTP